MHVYVWMCVWQIQLKCYEHNLPTIQHFEFAHRTVNIAIAPANKLLNSLCTIGWTIDGLVAASVCGPLLLHHTKWHWNFENMLSAICWPHFTSGRIYTTIRSTCGSSHSPATLSAHPCALAMLAIRTHNALTTSQQFHFARRIVHIPIGATGWTVFRCTVTIDWARFTDCTRIATRSNMGQRYGGQSHSTCLHSKHTSNGRKINGRRELMRFEWKEKQKRNRQHAFHYINLNKNAHLDQMNAESIIKSTKIITYLFK